jgi:hypothetical protein
MPIDPNIAMSYKPVGLDIAGAMQAAEERKLMRSRNALAGTQQAAAQDELNNALAVRRYAGNADLSDPQNAMRLLRYGKEGADMYQSLLAGQASSASARKTKLEASGVKAGQYRQMLSFVNDPNAAMQWIQMHHDDPDMQDSPVARMPLDVAMSRIPQDPAGFQKWKETAALGIDEYIKRNTLTANEQSMEDDRAEQRGISRGQLSVAQRNAAVNEAAEARLSSNSEAPLAPKERQKREAAFPKASAAFRGATTELDTQIKNLKVLRDHPGLSGITGLVYGRTPAITANAREANALLKTILARGGFQALADMRANSPTGGALGNVSDTEGRYLRDSYGSFDTTQDTPAFQRAIDNAIAQAESSKLNIQQAYDDTYSYRQGAAPAGDASKPAALPAAASSQLKEGVNTTFKNGQVWTLQNGQPVQVK